MVLSNTEVLKVYELCCCFFLSQYFEFGPKCQALLKIEDITFRAASDRVRFSSWREIGAGNGALCAFTMDPPVGPELQNQLLCPRGDVARAVVLTEPGEQVHEHQPSTRGHWW